MIDFHDVCELADHFKNLDIWFVYDSEDDYEAGNNSCIAKCFGEKEFLKLFGHRMVKRFYCYCYKNRMDILLSPLDNSENFAEDIDKSEKI